MATSKAAIRKVEILAERCILLDSLFFKITLEKELAVLAVPESCTDKFITLYCYVRQYNSYGMSRGKFTAYI